MNWIARIRPTVPKGGALSLAVLLIVVVLVVARSILFVAFEQAAFDSDQASFGLMAKHIADGRAFPVFPYGEGYMLTIESWFIAPFFLAFGVSVATLKLPLVILNILIGSLLVVGFIRESRLAPAIAVLVASYFLFPAPSISSGLVNAGGGNIEPFLVTLLLWMTRRRPLVFGVIAAVGFLNREFTAYALAALFLLDALDRSMFSVAYAREKLTALVSFAATWTLVDGLAPYGSAYGPGTSLRLLPPPSADALGARACVDIATLPGRLIELFGWYLGSVLGARPVPAHEVFVNSTLMHGVPGLWWLVGGLLLFSAARIGWLAATAGARPWAGSAKFATYVCLVGLQAALFYTVSRCAPLHLGTMRYVLLVVFGLAGLTACHLALEPSGRLRAIALGAPILLGLGAAASHLTVAVEYWKSPPPATRRLLANYLEERGIRFGHAPYWEAYHINFLTNERVRLASTVPRIFEYQWLFEAHPDDAVIIQYRACPGGVSVAGAYYVCPPVGGTVTDPGGAPSAAPTASPDPEGMS